MMTIWMTKVSSFSSSLKYFSVKKIYSQQNDREKYINTRRSR